MKPRRDNNYYLSLDTEDSVQVDAMQRQSASILASHSSKSVLQLPHARTMLLCARVPLHCDCNAIIDRIN